MRNRRPRLRVMVAQAHAAAGERWTALTCIRCAEADVDRATSAPDAECGYDHLGLAHQTGIVLATLGDPATSLSHLGDALDNRTDDERRSRVLITSRLAAAQVAAGAPDAAGRTIVAIEPDIVIVQSARVNRLLTDVAAGLPQSTDPTIQHAHRIVAETIN